MFTLRAGQVRIKDFGFLCLTYLKHCGLSAIWEGGGGVVERTTPVEKVLGTIPAGVARSLLVWSVTV